MYWCIHGKNSDKFSEKISFHYLVLPTNTLITNLSFIFKHSQSDPGMSLYNYSYINYNYNKYFFAMTYSYVVLNFVNQVFQIYCDNSYILVLKTLSKCLEIKFIKYINERTILIVSFYSFHSMCYSQ